MLRNDRSANSGELREVQQIVARIEPNHVCHALLSTLGMNADTLEVARRCLRDQVQIGSSKHTELFERAGVDVSGLPSFVWMEPEAVVAESLAALERGSGICVPGIGNRALSSLTGVLPTALLLRVGGALGRRIRHTT